VLISTKGQSTKYKVGEFYEVKITKAEEFDLYGELRIEN
jgi:tRNA A37 methylthiotransferase MiaB